MRASAVRGRPLLLFAAVSAAAFALDQAAKAVAARHLQFYVSVPEEGLFQLTLTHNTGSAFSLIGQNWILIAVTTAVCVVVLAYALAGGLAGAPGGGVALGLMLGGALGNLCDRLRTGGVIDFIDVDIWDWPVFNVADIAITVGVGLLALQLLRGRSHT